MPQSIPPGVLVCLCVDTLVECDVLLHILYLLIGQLVLRQRDLQNACISLQQLVKWLWASIWHADVVEVEGGETPVVVEASADVVQTVVPDEVVVQRQSLQSLVAVQGIPDDAPAVDADGVVVGQGQRVNVHVRVEKFCHSRSTLVSELWVTQVQFLELFLLIAVFLC